MMYYHSRIRRTLTPKLLERGEKEANKNEREIAKNKKSRV